MRRILYFIGAGLSKSLETIRPIPLMDDFVQVAADYIKCDDVILTTLAELENAGLYKENSPEAMRLAKVVVGRNHDRSQPTLRAFRKAIKERTPESIEALLVKSFEHDGVKNDAARLRFVYAIGRVFWHIGWELQWQPLHQFLKRQCQKDSTLHTFVSFNYDLILEKALQIVTANGWNPGSGYDLPDVFCTRDEGGVELQASPFPDSWESAGYNVRVLKPHGSVNWLVPLEHPIRYTSYGIAFENGPVTIPIEENGEIKNWIANEDFVHVSFPDKLPVYIGQCIVPPIKAKFIGLPLLRDIKQNIFQSLTKADEVFIIGWSMPQTDLDHETLIQDAIKARTQPLRRVVAVNYHAPPRYFDRMRHLFKTTTDRFYEFNEGFLDYCAYAS